MKKLLFLILVGLVIFISGCIGEDITELVKNTQQGKEFLSAYPNADMVAVRLSNDTVATLIDEIREICDSSIPIKSYWKITFSDPDTNTKLVSWIDAETQEPICFIKKGSSGVSNTTLNETKIQPQKIEVTDSYCTGNVVSFVIKNIGTNAINSLTCNQTAPSGDTCNLGNVNIAPGTTQTFTDVCSGDGGRACNYRLAPATGNNVTVTAYCIGEKVNTTNTTCTDSDGACVNQTQKCTWPNGCCYTNNDCPTTAPYCVKSAATEGPEMGIGVCDPGDEGHYCDKSEGSADCKKGLTCNPNCNDYRELSWCSPMYSDGQTSWPGYTTGSDIRCKSCYEENNICKSKETQSCTDSECIGWITQGSKGFNLDGLSVYVDTVYSGTQAAVRIVDVSGNTVTNLGVVGTTTQSFTYGGSTYNLKVLQTATVTVAGVSENKAQISFTKGKCTDSDGVCVNQTETQGIMVVDAYCSGSIVTVVLKNIGTNNISSITCSQTAPVSDTTCDFSGTMTPQIAPGTTQTFTDVCGGTGGRACNYRLAPATGNNVTVTAYCTG